MFGEYISEAIGDEYKSWTSKQPVIIHAPMGTGKTHFILNVLLPYAHRCGKKIAYFANRVALKLQVEHAIPAEYRDDIITCSYQQLASGKPSKKQTGKGVDPNREKEGSTIRTADYYVLDEAHFFLADSSFNTSMQARSLPFEYRRMRKIESVNAARTVGCPKAPMSAPPLWALKLSK